jgi:hypothetical protein
MPPGAPLVTMPNISPNEDPVQVNANRDYQDKGRFVETNSTGSHAV